MKLSKHLLLVLLPTLSLFACNEGDNLLIENATEISDSVLKVIDKKATLLNYIQHTHPEAYSRGTYSDLLPLVYAGDTVAYLMNYEIGWEMYSNSLTMPILLMKSDEGSIYPNTLTNNPTLDDFIELSKKALFDEKNSPNSKNQEGSYEWSLYALNYDSPNGVPLRKPVPKQTYRIGMNSFNEKDTINHLIKTKWDQGDPFNVYCPYVKDTYRHATAGCGAVAAAQFLYYSHYKWNKPVNCVDTQTYDIITNKYTFSGASASIWDQMPHATYSDTTPALLIGYAAQQMNTLFGIDSIGQESSTYPTDFISFVNTHADISLSRKSLSSKDVYECLKKDKPVPADIYRPKTNSRADVVSGSKSGHVVIIDYCRRDMSVIEYYSAELSEDPGYGQYPPFITFEQAERQYGKIEISREIGRCSYFFKANWGWGPYVSDPEINGTLLEVTYGNRTYDEMYMMTY